MSSMYLMTLKDELTQVMEGIPQSIQYLFIQNLLFYFLKNIKENLYIIKQKINIMQQFEHVCEDLQLIQQGNNSYIHRRCHPHQEAEENQAIKSVFHSQLLFEIGNKAHQRECTDLLNEWKILSSLNHPNIIKVKNLIQNHQIETVGNKLYCCSLFMECAFCDLHTLCNSKDVLAFDSLTHYFGQIGGALQYMQQKGYAHNDIKLENILLTSRSVAKLADFGFAGIATLHQDPRQWLPRTLNIYSSPEIINYRNQLHASEEPIEFSSFSSDVYALTTALFLSVYKNAPISGSYPSQQDNYYRLIINEPDQFWDLEFITKQDQIMKSQNISQHRLESLKDLLENGLLEEQDRLNINDFVNHEFFEENHPYD
ncbi:hypothetical protein pb186bvf_009876 [Paramecium bursaria]